mmetsp:Transcript_199/g.862  ORF Transcript_199/g.862 Transcript_199/m.862 type:complete len:220 (-) Transcript_199:28-687(-)
MRRHGLLRSSEDGSGRSAPSSVSVSGATRRRPWRGSRRGGSASMSTRRRSCRAARSTPARSSDQGLGWRRSTSRCPRRRPAPAWGLLSRPLAQDCRRRHLAILEVLRAWAARKRAAGRQTVVHKRRLTTTQTMVSCPRMARPGRCLAGSLCTASLRTKVCLPCSARVQVHRSTAMVARWGCPCRGSLSAPSSQVRLRRRGPQKTGHDCRCTAGGCAQMP